MNRLRISFDQFGREAFAYLAVILMVLSGFLISYQVFLRSENDERIRQVEEIRSISLMLSEDLSMIKTELIGFHNSVIIESESEFGEQLNTTTLDALIQMKIKKDSSSEMQRIIQKSKLREDGYKLSVLELDIDPLPIWSELDTPVPSLDTSNTSGLTTNTKKPTVIGINATFHLDLEVTDSKGTFKMKRCMDFHHETMTLTPMIMQRMDRFQRGLDSTEYPELLNYIIGTLAQMKCLMGYGRQAYGEVTELITEREILACADLSLSILSKMHLHGIDDRFLMNISENFTNVQGSNGKGIDLPTFFSENHDIIDPSILPILSEGLFERNNPPDLDMMIRPILSSIVDGILLRLLDFIGMGEWFYLLVGGMSEVFEIGKELMNSISKTFLGKELIDTAQGSAEEIFREAVSTSNLFPNDEPYLMNRALQGVFWNGGPITHYPKINLPDMNREFEVYLHSSHPENEMYIDGEGNLHSKAEYIDPEDVFIGWNSTLHQISLNFKFDEIEPSFNRVPIEDDELFNELSLYLGTISTSDSSAEKIMMEKGKMAIRKGIDNALELLSSIGNEEWKRCWIGWNSSDLPDIEGNKLPISEMISIEMDPLKKISNILSTNIIEQFDITGFLSFLKDTGSSYRTAVASFLKDNFDAIVSKQEQIGYCLDNQTELISDGCHWSIIDHDILNEGLIVPEGTYMVEDPGSIISITGNRQLILDMGLGIKGGTIEDIELYSNWRDRVFKAYNETFIREMGNGGTELEDGFIWSGLINNENRGGNSQIISVDLDPLGLSKIINIMIEEGLDLLEDSFYFPLNRTSGRILCNIPNNNNGFLTNSGWISSDLSISRLSISTASLTVKGGTYYSDPLESNAPYHSEYSIRSSAAYIVSYSCFSDEIKGEGTSTRIIETEFCTDLNIVSLWPMAGIEYIEQGDLIGRLKDQAKEALNTLIEGLEEIGNKVLGDTMSSLRDVPPLVMDLVEGKELDLAEISRVISNITMDASTTIREGVRNAINELVDMGVTGLLDWLCSLIGLDMINVSLDLGSLEIGLYSERGALQGEKGEILTLDINFEPIGMSSRLSFSRIEDGTLDFNGTLIFDLGPLYLRIELDHFMERLPHMISIEGCFKTKGDPIRFSMKCPVLEEYRSCEISLGSSLGVEPFIPIPILGINAVIDAGFRLRYKMPGEMEPHLNEIMIENGMVIVEIYNPRSWSLYGSTIVMEGSNGENSISWRIEETEGSYPIIDTTLMNIWQRQGYIDMFDEVRILLRDPSGELLDDVTIYERGKGWYSRDADGYGVWRWGDGSPGSSNSLSIPGDIKTILISIAISSLKEAWEISFNQYGLSFDLVVPFLQLALDLFMERFLSIIRELVIDVVMFLDIMVTDSSGIAGSGLELIFSADGEAVSDFFQWLYDNLKIFIMQITDPSGAGDYSTFPWEILHRCRIGIMVFSEVEIPIPIANLAPPGVNLPGSFRIAMQGSISISFPMLLLGMDVEGFTISLGVYVMDAPPELVSLFYDVGSTSMTTNLWLLKIEIWQGD